MLKLPKHPNHSITKDGRVWSHRRKIWLKPYSDTCGYLRVNLHPERPIHQLVLEAYVGPCPEGMQCRHLNGNKQDNNLDNLRWGTQSENQQDSIRHGTYSNGQLGKFGEKHQKSKLSDQDRRLIFSVYHDGAYTQRELADHFKVHCSNIHYIVHQNRWGLSPC